MVNEIPTDLLFTSYVFITLLYLYIELFFLSRSKESKNGKDHRVPCKWIRPLYPLGVRWQYNVKKIITHARTTPRKSGECTTSLHGGLCINLPFYCSHRFCKLTFAKSWNSKATNESANILYDSKNITSDAVVIKRTLIKIIFMILKWYSTIGMAKLHSIEILEK